MIMSKKEAFLKNKKILVTGANGFIGRNVVARLNSLCLGCVALERAVFDIVEGDIDVIEQSDIVIHLAAYVHPVESWSNIDKCLSVNVIGTKNILDYAVKNGADVLYVNTYVYGNPKELPITEELQVSPNTPYAVSKLMGEDLCKFYSLYKGLNVTSLRLFNVYGDASNDIFLVSKIINQYKNGATEISVFSDNTFRDFVHVDDVIDAILSAIPNMESFQVFNIGSGKSYSSRDIFNTLNELVSEKLTFSCTGEARINDVGDIVSDVTKASDLLNWTPKISLKEGVERALNE